MRRIRTIKPEFFRHVGLYKAEVETRLPLRLAFAGLWTAADRDGRFRWEPEALKLDCLPYDKVDFARVLDALVTRGFVVRYASDGQTYGFIPSWTRHQVINNRESASSLPAPAVSGAETASSTRAPRVDDACPTPLVQLQGEGKGREGKGREGEGGSAAADASTPPVLTFPCQGTEPVWHLSPAQVAAWGQLYPDLDIVAECQHALAYVEANGRKTAVGMPRYLVTWFNRSVRMGAGRKAPSVSARPRGWDSWRPDEVPS